MKTIRDILKINQDNKLLKRDCSKYLAQLAGHPEGRLDDPTKEGNLK